MRVLELWRHPVKSLGGERVAATEVGREGLAGDRRWALFDLDTGFGLTARRVPDLLFASARLTGDGGVEVVLPDGTVTADDAVLSTWLGRRVALRAADEQADGRHYEIQWDEEDETSAWSPFQGADGSFHDNSTARVSLVGTGTLRHWDRRRFRANVVLEGDGEDALVGAEVQLGGARLEVTAQIPRCVMTTRPQPDGIGRDTSVLRTIHRERGGVLAVGALVRTPGTVRVGDELRVLAPAGG
jgi:uncharacterized protein YcbX